jgi:hypothetical protein
MKVLLVVFHFVGIALSGERAQVSQLKVPILVIPEEHLNNGIARAQCFLP